MTNIKTKVVGFFKAIFEKTKTIFKKTRNNYFSGDAFEEDKLQARSIIRCFVALALIFGVLIIFLAPPFTVPDENAHYINLFRIIDGSFFPNVVDNNLGSNLTMDQDQYLSTFYLKYTYLAENTEQYTIWDMYHQEYALFVNDSVYFRPSGLANINPMAYIIPALGGKLVYNVFGISTTSTVVMGAKLASLAFYVVLIALALKITPVLRRTILLVALMPMSIYQGSSFSYDAVLIPASILLFAIAMKIFFADEDYVISIKDIFIVCFASAFIFSTKIAYAPLIIFFLAISIKKFGGLKRFFVCIGLIAVIGIIFYLIPTYVANSIAEGCLNTVEHPNIALQKQFFKENPFIIFPVLINTATKGATTWVKGFFGVLGTLDTNFPIIFIIIYYIILLGTALLELSTIKGFNWKARLLTIAGPAIFYVGTIMAMYLTWTPCDPEVGVGANYSIGTQGRYFIPVVLFGLMILANPLLKRFKHTSKIVCVLTDVTRLTVLIYSILTALMLLIRYWV